MTADTSFTAAMVQLRSGQTVAANISEASALIREAAKAGAHYVQTPEMTSLLVRDRERLMNLVAEEEHDTALLAFRDLAHELKIHLHIGSLAVRFPDARERVANRGFLIGPDGGILARYDKIHMFDVDLDKGESWRESRTYQPGEVAITADLPWGRLGMTICYDLRFSALYRALAEAGACFLAVPAAFTQQTGEAHWHVLLRARAIETGSFVFAAAQAGTHEDGRETFGHSLIVDPWGKILAEADAEPGVVLATIDPQLSADARRRIPVLDNGRRFAMAASDPVHLHEVRK
jgi:deaminated glutathione amidase